MAADRSGRIFELFAAARELPASQRASYLDAACKDDEALRLEVESLLGHDEADDVWAEDEIGEGREFLDEFAKTPDLPQTIGAYRVLSLIGEGGMGRVFEAEQVSPNRRVALKVIQPGRYSAASTDRFKEEVELLGRLHHPGIAQIYESGMADVGGISQPYIAMELVEGKDLQDWSEGRSLFERVDVLIKVAQAIHHAHHRGVLHRDLKPANVMVNDEGLPKILDFGVARATTPDIDRQNTMTGQVIGTLDYMSPEQLQGRSGDLSFSSDVYALGVMTFQIIAKTLPHRLEGKPLSDVLKTVCYGRSRSLRSVDPSFPKELDLICAKALAKEAGHRYASAEDFADDLVRWRENRPVQARPPSTLDDLRLFARRNKGLAAATTGVMVILLVGLIAFAILADHAAEQRNLAVAESEKSQRIAYRLAVSSAAVAERNHDVVEAQRLLEETQPRFRNWEWRCVFSKLDRSLARLHLDLKAQPEPATPPFFDRKNNRVMIVRQEEGGSGPSGLKGVVTSWNLGSLSLEFDKTVEGSGALPLSHQENTLMALDSSGAVLVMNPVDATVYRYDPIADHRGPDLKIDQAEVVAQGRELEIRKISGILIGRRRGAQAWLFLRDSGRVLSYVRMDERHNRVAILGGGASRSGVDVFDVETGALIRRVSGPRQTAYGVDFSPDGKTLATSLTNGSVMFWDLESGEQADPAVLACHEDRANDVAFSPNGELVATCGQDLSIRVWRWRESRPLGTLVGHRREVVFLKFIDDDHIISADRSGQLRYWSLESLDDGVLRGHRLFVYPSCQSPDGSLIASGGWDGCIRFWDAATGEEVAEMVMLETQKRYDIVKSLAFSQDGRFLAFATTHAIFDDHRIKVMDVLTGSIVADLGRVGGRANLQFCPAVGRLIVNSESGTKAFRVKDWVEVAEVPSIGRCLAVDREGQRFAIRLRSDRIGIYDAASMEEQVILTVPGESVGSLAFSPDGSQIALGGRTDIRVFDIASAELVATLRGHVARVFSLAFSPDGTRLASGSDDRSIRLWDTEDFAEVIQLRGHRDHVYSLSWSPDGGRLVSGSGDHTLRIWDDTTITERRRIRDDRESTLRELEPRARAWVDQGQNAEALRRRLESVTSSKRPLLRQAILMAASRRR